MQTQLKLMHWSTKDYGHHKALGSAAGELDELIDDVMEISSGAQAKHPSTMPLAQKVNATRVDNILSPRAQIKAVKGMNAQVRRMRAAWDKAGFPAVVVSLDDVLATLERLVYLMQIEH